MSSNPGAELSRRWDLRPGTSAWLADNALDLEETGGAVALAVSEVSSYQVPVWLSAERAIPVLGLSRTIPSP